MSLINNRKSSKIATYITELVDQTLDVEMKNFHDDQLKVIEKKESNMVKKLKEFIVTSTTDCRQAKLELLTFLAEQSCWIGHRIIEHKNFLALVTNIMLGFTMAQTDAEFSCVAFSMIKLMSVVAKKHGECK